MQVDIRANGIEMSESLREHTQRCLNFGLDWAKQDVDRIVITLSDINGPRGGNDKRCQLRIPLPRMRDVVIEETAGDIQLAITRSVDRAARSLERRLSRQREFDSLPLCPTEDEDTPFEASSNDRLTDRIFAISRRIWILAPLTLLMPAATSVLDHYLKGFAKTHHGFGDIQRSPAVSSSYPGQTS